MDSGISLGKTWNQKLFRSNDFPLLKNWNRTSTVIYAADHHCHLPPSFGSNPPKNPYAEEATDILLPEQCNCTKLELAIETGLSACKHQSLGLKTLKMGQNSTWRDFTLTKKKGKNPYWQEGWSRISFQRGKWKFRICRQYSIGWRLESSTICWKNSPVLHVGIERNLRF